MLAKGRTMAAKVFISYRRDDSADAAGRIQDRLAGEFGFKSLMTRGGPMKLSFMRLRSVHISTT
jgi:hypothetical protein